MGGNMAGNSPDCDVKTDLNEEPNNFLADVDENTLVADTFGEHPHKAGEKVEAEK